MTFARVTNGPLAFALLALLTVTLYTPGLYSLPATDRDEARFAQATRQMVESGDYVNIRFQSEPRNKKPVGIHWLQSVSVQTLSGDQTRAIWAYRLPSALGVAAGVLALFALMRPLTGAPSAFIAAALLAATPLAVAEAHIAKTDGVLLALAAIAFAALTRAYAGACRGIDASHGIRLAFWGAIGAGILIKGPVLPLIAALAVATLMIADRRERPPVRLIRALRPLSGLILAALIAAPWFIAISAAGESGFLSQAIRGDLIPKLLGGQESHGAPPFTHLALAPLTFWPAALFAPIGLIWAWKSRTDPVMRAALAWLVPAWIGFEAMPTKLAHYVLPLFPALAVIVAVAVIAASGPAERWMRGVWGRTWLGIWVLVGLAITATVPLLAMSVDGPVPTAAWVAAFGASVTTVVGAWAFLRGPATLAALAPVALVPLFFAPAIGAALPMMDMLWPSRGAAVLVTKHHAADAPPVAVAGYHEPSLVFALGADTMLTSAEGAARHIVVQAGALALITDSEAAKFHKALAARKARAQRLGTVRGFNTAKGKRIVLGLYRVAKGEP